MKNELEISLSSRRPLTESSATEQIAALSQFDGGLMCPDKIGEFEPIKTPFNPVDLEDAVRWLAKPHGTLLYRKGKPIQLSGEMWNRTLPPTSRFPTPLFSNYWTGRFKGKWVEKIGTQKVEDFLSEMFRITYSDFAFLTTAVDSKAKNQSPTSFSYQGRDLASGIPGLYWINLFSATLAEWLGLSRLPRELAIPMPLPDGGIMLKFCESPDYCRDADVLQRQRAAIDWLGPQRFFDIRFPDRKLETPDCYHLPSTKHEPNT